MSTQFIIKLCHFPIVFAINIRINLTRFNLNLKIIFCPSFVLTDNYPANWMFLKRYSAISGRPSCNKLPLQRRMGVAWMPDIFPTDRIKLNWIITIWHFELDVSFVHDWPVSVFVGNAFKCETEFEIGINTKDCKCANSFATSQKTIEFITMDVRPFYSFVWWIVNNSFVQNMRRIGRGRTEIVILLLLAYLFPQYRSPTRYSFYAQMSCKRS